MKIAAVRKVYVQLEVTNDIDFVIVVISAARRAQTEGEFGRVSSRCWWALEELLQLAEEKYAELKGQLPD